MAANILDLPRNFSLYTIPAAWLLSIAPHFYAISQGPFDNKTPRTYTSTASSSQTLDRATKDRITRAEGAQQNGFENLGLFAAAVVVGNVAGLDNATLNGLAGAYLVSRVAYNGLYLAGTTDMLSNLRSVSFLTGVGIIFTFFIKSGNVLKNKL